jgi:hypothetical protein
MGGPRGATLKELAARHASHDCAGLCLMDPYPSQLNFSSKF